MEKGVFPNNFDSNDKINETELPSHDEFFSKMKNKNITDDEYDVCINTWKDNKMKTLKDFLEWYNNLDVLPFVEAIEKMKDTSRSNLTRARDTVSFGTGDSFDEHLLYPEG